MISSYVDYAQWEKLMGSTGYDNSLVTNWALQQVMQTHPVCVTGVSANQDLYDQILVEKSLAAFAIFWRPYQKSPFTYHMLLVQL